MLGFFSLAVFLVQAFRHARSNPDARLGESLAHGAVWGGGVYVGGRALQAGAERYRVATNPRVFMPHHHGPDGEAKEWIALAGATGDFGFTFQDVSPRRRIKTQDPSRIRAHLTRGVRKADKLMVVIGEDTHQRPYVNHEIAKAIEAQRPIVAVKLAKRFAVPPALYGIGVAWASPRPESIAKALERV